MERLDSKNAILETILKGTLILAVATVVLSVRDYLYDLDNNGYVGIGLAVPIVTLAVIIWLYFLTKRGHTKLASSLLVLAILIPTMYTSIKWESLVPQGIVAYALIIFISAILLGSRLTFLLTFFVCLFLITLSYLQTHGIVTSSTAWRQEVFDVEDNIIASLTFAAIAVVAWLAEKEIKKHQKALLEERDSLDRKVKEHEQLAQVTKFAEFGKISSGLIHDLANPLTIVSNTVTDLNLEQAIRATKKMEQFVNVARKQFSNDDRRIRFDIGSELSDVLLLLSHKIRDAVIILDTRIENNVWLYGNPTKMSKVLTNLIANSIDSFEICPPQNKNITVQIGKSELGLKVSVWDNGCGIDAADHGKVFEPFYTTKANSTGTGLGLVICKDIIEKDFGGKIYVESEIGKGSVFHVEIPL